MLPLFYPFGRFERLKTVLMGTSTPHACISGLVWQKQARRCSQFELKVGELVFPIHFVCVSAALHHRGYAAAIFPLGEYGPFAYYGLDEIYAARQASRFRPATALVRGPIPKSRSEKALWSHEREQRFLYINVKIRPSLVRLRRSY